MPASVGELFRSAEKDFKQARWERALAGYVAVIRVAPRFPGARYRVADCLLNLGDKERAKEVYKSLAWHFIRTGHPLLGLVLCKMVLALDPSYEELLHVLAELYSSESDRVAEVELPPPPSLPDGGPPPELPRARGPDLLEEAARTAIDLDDLAAVPPNFPRIPLFSHLREDAFVRVLHRLRLRRFRHSDVILREGTAGDSFFMLANGQVTVWKQHHGQPRLFARLYPGAVFGEMALVGSSTRTATVRAEGDVDALELSRLDLEAEAEQLETVRKALIRFTRSRFLANLAATSPLFSHLDPARRRALLGEFEARRFQPEDVIIEQGERGPGLFLVLRGMVEVVESSGQSLARLGSGAVFGEVSLLHDRPTTASVVARGVGEVLFLSRARFEDLLAQVPEVWSTLRALSEERLSQRSSPRDGVDASLML
jgi:CRP-like cAMP-binding protein